MTPFSALYPELLTYAPMASEPAMDLAIRRTVDTFCRVTQLWRHVGDTVDVSAADVDVDAPAGGWPFLPLSVTLDGQQLPPSNLLQITQERDWETATGIPETYYSKTEGEITLYPAPSGTHSITILSAVTITPTAKTLDDLLAVRHHDTLIAGALFRLLATPGQPYSNPQMAGVYGAEFARGMSAAHVDSENSHTQAPMRVSPNPI